jgi:NAD(P)-dependent dehydrogenase (short-subunit alcohol dehydrogenase family)
MSQQQLSGKAVLITGAGSGLGEATAHAFAKAGCSVACVDLNEQGAQRVGESITKENDVQAVAYQCDVSNANAVFETVKAVGERFGHLDVVVNCAATDYVLPVEEMTVEQWDRVIGVNLRGPFLFAKAAFPLMRTQGGGHIINIASTAALRAWGNASAYHASKTGLVAFGRGLGVEGRPYNIRVTTVLPGGMKTHFFDHFADLGIPMPDEKNLQDPANVAAVIVFAAQMPPESSLQEVLVTPLTETSWP